MGDLLLRNATDKLRPGELAVDPTTYEVYRGDGTTPGGHKLAGSAEVLLSAAPTMWVWDDDAGKVFCRTSWDATDDLVFTLTKVGVNNAAASIFGIGTVPIGSAIGGTPSPTALATISDDFAPIMSAWRGYFSGNHFLELTNLTVPGGHGLNADGRDIGKRYTDGTDEFAISAIISPTVIQLVSKAKTLASDGAYVDYRPALTGLTSPDGLSAIGSGAYTAPQATTQQSILSGGTTSQWLVDGLPLQTGDTVRGAKLELIVTNRIVDVGAAFAYFAANIGSGVWTGVRHAAVETIHLTFYANGTLSIDSTLRWTPAASIDVRNWPGSLQSYPPSAHCWHWAPGAGVHTQSFTLNGGAVTSVDFAQPVRIATLSADLEIATTATRITGVPMDTWIDFKTSTDAAASPYLFSSAYGFDPTWSDGIPANRAANGTVAIRINDTTKRYPTNRKKTVAIPTGTLWHLRAWRAWQKPTTESDWWTCVRSGDKWLVYIAWLTNTAPKLITLPGYVTYTTATKTREYLGTVDINGRTVTVTPSGTHGLVILALS